MSQDVSKNLIHPRQLLKNRDIKMELDPLSRIKHEISLWSAQLSVSNQLWCNDPILSLESRAENRVLFQTQTELSVSIYVSSSTRN